MNTYTVALPTGEIVTKSSKRTITHAILAIDPRTNKWFVLGYSGSEAAALKQARTDAKHFGPQTQAVPVTVAS